MKFFLRPPWSLCNLSILYLWGVEGDHAAVEDVDVWGGVRWRRRRSGRGHGVEQHWVVGGALEGGGAGLVRPLRHGVRLLFIQGSLVVFPSSIIISSHGIRPQNATISWTEHCPPIKIGSLSRRILVKEPTCYFLGRGENLLPNWST